jgi:C-terminal processing protease CtpA/Prc
VPGAGKQLRDALKGAREVSLDLRNAGANSFEALSECLAAVAPSGTYGRIRRSGGKAPEAVKVPSGNDRAPKVKLLINTRTRGAAEAFALALSKSGRATLDGGAMAGDPAVIELRKLPEGSGYSLVTGTFEATSVRKEARGS